MHMYNGNLHGSILTYCMFLIVFCKSPQQATDALCRWVIQHTVGYKGCPLEVLCPLCISIPI